MKRAVRASLWLLALAACRVETVAPGSGGAAPGNRAPAGELWIYTSMYRSVIDAFEPLTARALPGVTVHWYQAGSEKVANRLEAELAAGGTQADVLLTSDPFLYERYKREGRWLRYASPNVLRVPRTLLDLDGQYAACRLSTMVLAYRTSVEPPPRSFKELTEPRWKGQVALGDPMASGTAFTWALFLSEKYGAPYFQALRGNGAVLAGGNAAVQQRLEAGESSIGVMLLENALVARDKGSPVAFVYPDDGAVLVPGFAAIFRSSRNPSAAQAFVDLMLSEEGQRLLVSAGDMHGVDPRVDGPRGEPGLEQLLRRSQPWSEALLARGLERGPELKAELARAFQR